MAKHQANAQQHPEAELLLFDNYSHSSSTLSCYNSNYKLVEHILKNKQKNKCVCIYKITPGFFYKQPVYKQLALGWQIAKQLSGLNPFSLGNNKNYRLKKGVSPL